MALSASRRKQSKAMETYLTHVQTLSNNELMDGLIRMGEDPGPINPSTRSVYERKLAKLLEEEKIERDNCKYDTMYLYDVLIGAGHMHPPTPGMNFNLPLPTHCSSTEEEPLKEEGISGGCRRGLLHRGVVR